MTGYQPIGPARDGVPIVPLGEALAQQRHGEPRHRIRPLQPIEAIQLHGQPVPERRWLVDGWIPDRAVTLLGGDGGTGKSLLCLQLQAACALGRPWLGMSVPCRRSLGLYCEDDGLEVHIRMAAVTDSYGVSFGDLEGMYWDPRSGKENVLMSFGERDNAGKLSVLFERVKDFCGEYGIQLLTVDTLADMFAGNENFRAQARAFINALRSLAIAMDGAVILTAHPSVAGQASGSGLSGSTAWNNSVRSRLYLTRPTADDVDPDERLLKRVKANYSGINDQIRMKWQRGVFVPLDAPGGIDRIAMHARADRVFRELLRATYETGVWVSPSPTANNYAPTLFGKRPDSDGLAKPAFEAAMHRLVAAGTVRTEKYGRRAEPRTRLCLA